MAVGGRGLFDSGRCVYRMTVEGAYIEWQWKVGVYLTVEGRGLFDSGRCVYRMAVEGRGLSDSGRSGFI